MTFLSHLFSWTNLVKPEIDLDNMNHSYYQMKKATSRKNFNSSVQCHQPNENGSSFSLMKQQILKHTSHFSKDLELVQPNFIHPTAKSKIEVSKSNNSSTGAKPTINLSSTTNASSTLQLPTFSFAGLTSNLGKTSTEPSTPERKKPLLPETPAKPSQELAFSFPQTPAATSSSTSTAKSGNAPTTSFNFSIPSLGGSGTSTSTTGGINSLAPITPAKPSGGGPLTNFSIPSTPLTSSTSNGLNQPTASMTGTSSFSLPTPSKDIIKEHPNWGVPSNEVADSAPDPPATAPESAFAPKSAWAQNAQASTAAAPAAPTTWGTPANQPATNPAGGGGSTWGSSTNTSSATTATGGASLWGQNSTLNTTSWGSNTSNASSGGGTTPAWGSSNSTATTWGASTNSLSSNTTNQTSPWGSGSNSTQKPTTWGIASNSNTSGAWGATSAWGQKS